MGIYRKLRGTPEIMPGYNRSSSSFVFAPSSVVGFAFFAYCSQPLPKIADETGTFLTGTMVSTRHLMPGYWDFQALRHITYDHQ
jgi:hypothetical protein